MSTFQSIRHIDREQVRQQLAALGYKAGDTVYLRAFFPDTDPRKPGDKGRKADATNFDQLIAHATKFQAEGRGVYFVINGGGQMKKDIRHGRAIFYEHDNLDKATQTDLWKSLRLPEPTFQVDTGGKSIHSYWVFDEHIGIGDWQKLQADLLEFADADRSIKDPSRVMRLAGAWHSSGNQSLIISNSGKRYKYSDLREIVSAPKAETPLFQAKQPRNNPDSSGTVPKKYEDIVLPVPASIPLEACLAVASRDLLNGVSEGGRNKAGYILACDLIGATNYLQAIGQSFNGDAESLFQDFGDRCNPPLNAGELQSIWKSAQGSNPSPACKAEGVENCIKGHYWNSIRPATATNQSYGRAAAIAKPQKLSRKEAVALARATLKAATDEISVNLELEEIREKTGMSEHGWEHKIIKPLKREMDTERFKLELKGLLQIEDTVERCLKISQICPQYSMSAGQIKEAMAAMKSRMETVESRLWSLNEVFNLQSEGLQWIVPELLPCAESVVLSACPKAGKTLLATDLAFCVATGEEKFLGQKVKAGKVLLVSVDESLNSTRSKLLKRGFRLEDNENIKILPQWDITQTATLEAFLEDYRPDVVIIDSLKRICKDSSISENAAEFSNNIYTLKELLTRYGAAGVLIHHNNKNADALGVERLRGSSAIAGSVWGVWQVDHIPKKDPNNSKKMIIDPKDPKRIFSCFPRDAEGQTLDIELNLENNSWICHGIAGEEAEAAQQRETIREQILRTLEKHGRPLNGPEILETTELTEKRGSVYSELNRMVGKKVLSATPAPGNKRYTLYSLPHFQTEKILPPLPPSVSVPNAIYESETHTEHEFQTHSSIHSKHIAIDSTVTVESEMLSIANDCEDRDSGIDSKIPLAQGEGGVKCVNVAETVTTLKPEVAQAQPIAPPELETAPKTNAEWILHFCGKLRKAIAENDAGAINEEIAKIKKLDRTDRLRLAIKAELSNEEQEAFSRIFASHKQSQQQPLTVETEAEPIAPPDNSSATTPEPQLAEPAPTGTPIENLNLSCRAYNALQRAKITTIEQLLTYTPQSLLEIKNAGQRTVDEVVEVLQRLGFSLASEPIAPPDNSPAPESAEPLPEAAPQPASETVAEPTTELAPETVLETASDPELVLESAPEVPPAPAPEPTPEPALVPEPALEPAPETVPEPAPEPTPKPTLESTPEPAPTPQFKIGDRVRVVNENHKLYGKYGEIRSVANLKGIIGILFDYEKRRKTADSGFFAASEIELIVGSEEVEDAK